MKENGFLTFFSPFGTLSPNIWFSTDSPCVSPVGLASGLTVKNGVDIFPPLDCQEDGILAIFLPSLSESGLKGSVPRFFSSVSGNPSLSSSESTLSPIPSPSLSLSIKIFLKKLVIYYFRLDLRIESPKIYITANF